MKKIIRELVNEKIDNLLIRIKTLEEKYEKTLQLYVITDGKDLGCQSYLKAKIAKGKTLGIEVIPCLVKSLDDLRGYLLEINSFHIPCMIELPIEQKYYDYYMKIKPKTDVDGFLNVQDWYTNTNKTEIKPCTAQSCIDLLEYMKYDFKNKFTVIVGRGETVGKPLSVLLNNKKTNFICLSSTIDKEIRDYVLDKADCVICCSGKIDSISTKELNCNKNVIVLNVGICFDENGNLREECLPNPLNNNIKCTEKVGGIGLITTVKLFENVVNMYS